MPTLSIDWFPTLTRVLSSYMDVLRYEMKQGPGEQTVEALIHAEIFKILVREFPSNCVRSEFPIGYLFAPKEKEEDKEKEAKATYQRQFRADIAIFNPLDVPQTGADATVFPIAVFELKRTGSKEELHDDVYRLAVVGKRMHNVGYFVLAAPVKQLLNMVAQLEIFKSLTGQDVDPIEVQFSTFSGLSGIYNTSDHDGATSFHANLMYATSAVLDGLSKLTKSPGDADNGNASTDTAALVDAEQYGFIIYGIASNKASLKENNQHRIRLELSPAPQQKVVLDTKKIFEEFLKLHPQDK